MRDLVEAIVHPSRVVSEQYKASVVRTTAGRVVSGRIVGESPAALVIVTDPEDATKFLEIARADVEEVAVSSESLMPTGLLDQLNETEVLDLLAYVLSRDTPDARWFKPHRGCRSVADGRHGTLVAAGLFNPRNAGPTFGGGPHWCRVDKPAPPDWWWEIGGRPQRTSGDGAWAAPNRR